LSPADNREVSPHVVWRTPEGPCAMAVHADDHRSLSNWSLEPGLLHPLKMVSPAELPDKNQVLNMPSRLTFFKLVRLFSLRHPFALHHLLFIEGRHLAGLGRD